MVQCMSMTTPFLEPVKQNKKMAKYGKDNEYCQNHSSSVVPDNLTTCANFHKGKRRQLVANPTWVRSAIGTRLGIY